MARRNTPKRRGKQPTDLIPRLRAAVDVVDEALGRLADRESVRRARRTPKKTPR